MMVPKEIDDRTQQDFSAVRTLLHELFASDAITKELDRDGSATAKQVYGNAATLFAFVLQRLEGGLTLKQTVKRMIDHHRDMLRGDNQRVQEGTLSENASAYD